MTLMAATLKALTPSKFPTAPLVVLPLLLDPPVGTPTGPVSVEL